MQRPVGVVILASLLAACTATGSPTNAPTSATIAPPSTEATTAPTDSPTAVPPSPTMAPPISAPTLDASATLTPAAPDPGVSMVATWWLDPAGLPVDPQATRLHGFVLERGCSSGQSPEGRILSPDVDYGAEALTISYSIAPLPGDQDCQGNTPYGVVFELVEPVDGRPIFDGGTVPRRDATTIPEP